MVGRSLFGWCYNRFEDGKFGDQKYLDDLGARFSNKVHVLKNKELILAPWNATRFPYGNYVIWHFQGLRLIKKRSTWKVFFGFYKLPTPTKTIFTENILKIL